MSAKRHGALLALVHGSKLCDGSKEYSNIATELQELLACRRCVPEKRRGLLQILHATRALDTALVKAIEGTGVPAQTSIGKLLNQACNAKLLTEAGKNQYRKSIADERNRFMHHANEFPKNSKEVDALLGNVGACIAELISKL